MFETDHKTDCRIESRGTIELLSHQLTNIVTNHDACSSSCSWEECSLLNNKRAPYTSVDYKISGTSEHIAILQKNINADESSIGEREQVIAQEQAKPEADRLSYRITYAEQEIGRLERRIDESRLRIDELQLELEENLALQSQDPERMIWSEFQADIDSKVKKDLYEPRSYREIGAINEVVMVNIDEKGKLVGFTAKTRRLCASPAGKPSKFVTYTLAPVVAIILPGGAS